MPHSEVSKLYPLKSWDAKNPLKCEMEDFIKVSSYNHKGSRVQLHFFVSFEFDEQSPSGKLKKITLYSIAMMVSDVKLWDDTAKSLVNEYGKPDSEKSEGEQGPNTKTWVKPSGQLKFYAEGGGMSYCEITYTSKKD